MKTNFLGCLIILVFCISVGKINAQEHSEPSQDDKKEKDHLSQPFKKHRIGFIWGNTIVPAAKTATDESSVLMFPTWGLSYSFFFSKKIGISWLNELEMQSYIYEHDGHPEMEREYPFISSILFVYEPIHRLAFFAGPGIEFESSQNFTVFNLGVEYVFPLPNYFDLAFGVDYQTKNKTYDAWTIGLSIGKRLGKVKEH